MCRAEDECDADDEGKRAKEDFVYVAHACTHCVTRAELQMAAKDAKEAQTAQVEDDDEFEEFPKESLSHCADVCSLLTMPPDWGAAETDKTVNTLWQDDWDNDNLDDDFSKQLR